MEVDSPGTFAAKAFEWTAKLAPAEHEVFSSRPHVLEQFWVFAKAAETVFSESLGYQMGFGRCEKIPRQRDAKSIAQFQRDLAIRALAAPVLAPKAKSAPSAGSASSSTTPLLDLENAEKQKWAKRLKAIAERAGAHAKPLSTVDNEILSAEERARLQLLVFTSGAPSTMANHFRRIEKFEAWARRSSLPLYPITNDLILKYAVEVDGRECGPTVIPSLRMALRWVSCRTNIQVPSIDRAPLKALEKEVFHTTRQTSQRSRPYSHRARDGTGEVCRRRSDAEPNSNFHVVDVVHDLRLPEVRRPCQAARARGEAGGSVRRLLANQERAQKTWD